MSYSRDDEQEPLQQSKPEKIHGKYYYRLIWIKDFFIVFLAVLLIAGIIAAIVSVLD